MRSRLLPTRPREGADDGADIVAGANPLADCDFNLAALHPAYPIKRRTSAERTQASPERRHPEESPALDPLENNICKIAVVRRWAGKVVGLSDYRYGQRAGIPTFTR